MNTITITVDAVLAVLPRRLVRAFSHVTRDDDCVRLEHADMTSPPQRREEMHDARVALEAAGYRVADSAFTLLVFPAAKEYREPAGEHCEGQHGCGAPTPAQCRCHDDE